MLGAWTPGSEEGGRGLDRGSGGRGGAWTLRHVRRGRVRPSPPLCAAQGLSDFCSSPDSYILNLTQEETGLGSGDHISGRTLLHPQASTPGVVGCQPCPVLPGRSSQHLPWRTGKEGRDKDAETRGQGEGRWATWRKWGAQLGQRRSEAALWGVQSSVPAVAAAEGESPGAGEWGLGGLGGRGQRDHRRALSGEGGKCGPAPAACPREGSRGSRPPVLPSRFRHPELLFPLQPGRLQPLQQVRMRAREPGEEGAPGAWI